MHLEPNSPRRADEERRYFPDWIPRLLEVREELEADHNSYLAGGYAEEFGYHAEPGASRGVPVLDGELPEQSMEWLGQAAAMHPGYPIRACPVSSDREQTGAFLRAAAELQRLEESIQGSLEATRNAEYHGTFVRVTDRPYERDSHHAAQRAAAVLTRLLASIATLRWQLRHRR